MSARMRRATAESTPPDMATTTTLQLSTCRGYCRTGHTAGIPIQTQVVHSRQELLQFALAEFVDSPSKDWSYLESGMSSSGKWAMNRTRGGASGCCPNPCPSDAHGEV